MSSHLKNNACIQPQVPLAQHASGSSHEYPVTFWRYTLARSCSLFVISSHGGLKKLLSSLLQLEHNHWSEDKKQTWGEILQMIYVTRHRGLCSHLWHRQAVACDTEGRVTSLGLPLSGGPIVAYFQMYPSSCLIPSPGILVFSTRSPELVWQLTKARELTFSEENFSLYNDAVYWYLVSLTSCRKKWTREIR